MAVGDSSALYTDTASNRNELEIVSLLKEYAVVMKLATVCDQEIAGSTGAESARTPSTYSDTLVTEYTATT
jgi:hypothetical protein